MKDLFEKCPICYKEWEVRDCFQYECWKHGSIDMDDETDEVDRIYINFNNYCLAFMVKLNLVHIRHSSVVYTQFTLEGENLYEIFCSDKEKFIDKFKLIKELE